MSGILSLFFNILFGPHIFYGWMHLHILPNIVNESVLLISVLTMAALLLHYGEDSKFSVMGFSGKGRFSDFFMGFVIAAFIMGTGFYILLKMHQIKIDNIHVYKMEMLFSLLLYIIVTFAEEIAVRGYILGRMLRTNFNKYLALAVSAMIFALLHVFNSNIALLPLFNIFLAGVLLGATYIYTRNLWYPLSLHFFWNFLQGPILGFQVSGKANFKSLITLTRFDNTTLNGGSFGFEGSLVCTFLLILFIALTIWVMENKQFNKEKVENEVQA